MTADDYQQQQAARVAALAERHDDAPNADDFAPIVRRASRPGAVDEVDVPAAKCPACGGVEHRRTHRRPELPNGRIVRYVACLTCGHPFRINEIF